QSRPRPRERAELPTLDSSTSTSTLGSRNRSGAFRPFISALNRRQRVCRSRRPQLDCLQRDRPASPSWLLFYGASLLLSWLFCPSHAFAFQTDNWVLAMGV